MRSNFEKNGTISKEQIKSHLVSMLLSSRQEITSTDSIKVRKYDENPTDLTATVDPDELLVKGRISYWRIAIDGKQKKTEHSFEVRDCGDEIEVTIRDHAKIL